MKVSVLLHKLIIYKQLILPLSTFGTNHVNRHYKTNDPSITIQSFLTTLLGVNEFGNPFLPGEQTQFTQKVVQQVKHTQFGNDALAV